jgi:hypothetical protein
MITSGRLCNRFWYFITTKHGYGGSLVGWWLTRYASVINKDKGKHTMLPACLRNNEMLSSWKVGPAHPLAGVASSRLKCKDPETTAKECCSIRGTNCCLHEHQTMIRRELAAPAAWGVGHSPPPKFKMIYSSCAHAKHSFTHGVFFLWWII